MRWDIKVTVYLSFSAAFFAVSAMVGPDVLHLTEGGKVLVFFAGIGGTILFGAAGFITAIVGEKTAPLKGHKRRMIGLCGMIVCAVGFLGFATSYFWPRKDNDSADSNTKLEALVRPPLTMREIFDSDFNGVGRVFTAVKFSSSIPGEEIIIPVNLYFDLSANSMFLAVFMGEGTHAYELCDVIAGHVDSVLQAVTNSFEIYTQEPGGTGKISTDSMTFSRLIYIYTQEDMSVEQVYKLKQHFDSEGLRVMFRESGYLALHKNEHDRHIRGINNPVDLSRVPVVGRPTLQSSAITGLPVGPLPVPAPPAPSDGKSPQTSH